MPDLFINDYINKITFLEKQLGGRVGYKPMEPFWVPGNGFMDHLRLQGAAKEIANFLKLGQYTFLITATEQKANTAGSIELKYSGNDVFVEISEDVQGFEDAVIATLAHELVHKYMQVNEITLGTNIIHEYENEVLTDITTIFLGLGKFLLNGCNNKKTHHEYLENGKYKVTKTMKVGYLTQRQIAFVYRLICSMRGISEEGMLSNLNQEAKNSVLDCECYAKKYFNLDFKNKNYKKTIEDVTSNHLSQLQNRIEQIEKEIKFSESRIKQLRDKVETIKRKLSSILNELDHITKSSTYDPCMKFLECIKIEQWKNILISTVAKNLKEIKYLNKTARILRKTLEKEAEITKTKQKNKYKIIIVTITISLALIFGFLILGLKY